jgi:hypothetical protein
MRPFSLFAAGCTVISLSACVPYGGACGYGPCYDGAASYPAPAYGAPPAYAEPPVYEEAPPVYAEPPVVIYEPSFGWGYWDGERHWHHPPAGWGGPRRNDYRGGRPSPGFDGGPQRAPGPRPGLGGGPPPAAAGPRGGVPFNAHPPQSAGPRPAGTPAAVRSSPSSPRGHCAPGQAC